VKNFFGKNYKIIIFSAVILLAVFLRIWHFSDWLFFKMDQARDALLIQQAFENGIGWLPLLGPKAGGTDLNLGPAFYYFQYFSAVLFQSTHPAVLALPDLLFGTLAIFLFYFFLKKYFSRGWSMVLAGLYSINFLGIQYSRFAWNPNGLVFFNLLFFFSLLNIFDEKIKYRLRWVILAAVSFAVSTQLHFLSFFTLPVITLIFAVLNWKDAKKMIGWKNLIFFVAIVALIYLPVMLNEIFSKGENTSEFIKALKEKPSEHSFWKNVKRDFRYWGQDWFLILTSWISRKNGINGSILAWIGAVLPALYLGLRYFRREKNAARRNFVLITLLWFFVYFLAYIPIAYQIRPRFFLPLLGLPFVFIGYLAIFFWNKKHIFWKICVTGALLGVFSANLAGTFFWFREIQAAQEKGTYPWRTIILKAKDGITLWHLEKAADYIKSDCPAPVAYYFANSEYKYPVRYLLGMRDMEGVSIRNFDPAREGCFYAFGLTRSKKSLDASLRSNFEIAGEQKIGALKVSRLMPRAEFLSQSIAKKEKADEKRIFWKDILQ